jgi:hypothetical protein
MQQHQGQRAVTTTLQEKVEYIRRRCVEANPKASSRSIHLADVINALQGQYQNYIPDNTISILCQSYWNLQCDDLTEQSEENVDYIYKLLQGTL